MKQEITSMKAQHVYTEVSFSNLTKAQQSQVIQDGSYDKRATVSEQE